MDAGGFICQLPLPQALTGSIQSQLQLLFFIAGVLFIVQLEDVVQDIKIPVHTMITAASKITSKAGGRRVPRTSPAQAATLMADTTR